jgi:hypothetical protein
MVKACMRGGRLSWIVGGAVGALLLLAGLDALRSSLRSPVVGQRRLALGQRPSPTPILNATAVR